MASAQMLGGPCAVDRQWEGDAVPQEDTCVSKV